MFFLTSLASVCLRLRTISIARLTAETSIAAAVMMVLAGAGSACGCGAAADAGGRCGAILLRQHGLQGRGERRCERAGGLGGLAGFDVGLAAVFSFAGLFAAFATGFVSDLAFCSGFGVGL